MLDQQFCDEFVPSSSDYYYFLMVFFLIISMLSKVYTHTHIVTIKLLGATDKLYYRMFVWIIRYWLRYSMGNVLSCLASTDRLSDDAFSGSLIYQYMRKVTESQHPKICMCMWPAHGINNDIHGPALTIAATARASAYHFSSQLRDTTRVISTAL